MSNPPAMSVLVTGADKGLGLALVERFLHANDLVVAGVHTSATALEQLFARLGRQAILVALDVSDMESVRQAAREVARQIPHLDILINNAAIYPHRPVLPLEQEDFTNGHLERTMNVNAFGPLRVTQQFLPLLEKGQRKIIVNVSSEAGSISNCWRTSEFAYTMSKAALNMQSKILQNYLGARGYKILAIHPGWMRTEMGGPDADIDPAEAAEGIFALVNRPWRVDDDIYLDYRGQPMTW
jgi:NAD(P)-dependent dehydrogenase (short-subunit alcohol dehydrogenase family)